MGSTIQTDEENSSNINEEFETSENTFTQKLIRLCYYCSKPHANQRIVFKGELRQFCNDECYQSCLRKNDLSEKNLKEEQEVWDESVSLVQIGNKINVISPLVCSKLQQKTANTLIQYLKKQ
jgi:hypothetical protein